ncbi:MAG TPA: N-formylglutamate deformylase [Candidatus Dormibacteraeota bacterium]|nr:N-formylglutamate deformylase [Candidatus Dormibacteraeota bacterium]
MNSTSAWLNVQRGTAPLLLCMPHTGTNVPAAMESGLNSPWLSRKDTDCWIERLYDFAPRLGASVVHTTLSRTVIDANRDPSGASLYPGQATTELCPTTPFDGEPLYRAGRAPSAAEIAQRRRDYFEPYHAAVAAEIARLRELHGTLVVYDCHSIRSAVPRLFTGLLPHFNLGTFAGASCAPALTARIEALCDATEFTRVTNGRFKGGYTTRHYGRPHDGVHAVQMELACRGYLREPIGEVEPGNWPCAWDEQVAAPMRAVLERILTACIGFAAQA